MPARIFILSVVIIGLAFLVVPAARYLIWGPELDSEPVSVPNDSESGAVRELEIVRLLGKDAIPAILEPEFVSVSEADRGCRLKRECLVSQSAVRTGPTLSQCSVATRS